MTPTTNRSTVSLRPIKRFMLATSLAFAAPLVYAHHPMGGQTPETLSQGLLSGLGHPIIGLDHFAFLIVVALLSFTLTGRARFLVPAAFVGATVAGTLYHLGAAGLPLTETVIALSVLLGGIAILLKGTASAVWMGLLVGLAGIFHGYAYGEAIVGAEASPMLSYLVGFSLIQYLVIVAGIKAMDLVSARSQVLHEVMARVGGLSAAAVGAVSLGLSMS